MTKFTQSQQRKLELVIERALLPGTFVSHRRTHEFIRDLEEIGTKLGELTGTAPALAAELHATFVAACHEKADELDDSSGMFGQFVEELFEGWMRARMAAGADPDDTARLLAAWMDDDPYGFCMNLDRVAAKVMNAMHLKAFVQVARTSVAEAAPDDGHTAGYPRRRWTATLKRLLTACGDAASYLDVCGGEPDAADCLNLAAIHRRRRRPEDALGWAERGLRLEGPGGRLSYELEKCRRELLSRLGRSEELLAISWRAFERHPSLYTYKDLMEAVPREQRGKWREKALAASAGGTLESVLGLLLELGEDPRLEARVAAASEEQLEALGHYTIEPIAKRLHDASPAQAARLHWALAAGILTAGKSQAYPYALEHLARARDAYVAAGQTDAWEQLSSELAQRHRRKPSFMPGFERVLAGESGRESTPSLIERARRRQPR